MSKEPPASKRPAAKPRTSVKAPAKDAPPGKGRPKLDPKTTVEVRHSWIEIKMDDELSPASPAPPTATRSRGRAKPPPLPPMPAMPKAARLPTNVSLPGIEVKEEWLEPESKRGKKLPPPLPTSAQSKPRGGGPAIPREDPESTPPPRASKRPSRRA